MGKKKATSKKLARKEARQKVYDKLAVALAEFRAGIKKKKFEKKLREASKLFTVDLSNSINEKVKTPKIPKEKRDTSEDMSQRTA